MINVIRDGETYNHKELAHVFGFTNLVAFKNFIKENDIVHSPVNGIWWLAGEDVRRALRMGLVYDSGKKQKGDD